MDFNLALFVNVFLGQKVENVLALVTLHLDNLAHFPVFDNCSIAAEFLFEKAQNLFQIQIATREDLRDEFPKRKQKG